MPKQKPNEQVQQIPLSEIRPFKNHPFKVTDDELMQQTLASIDQWISLIHQYANPEELTVEMLNALIEKIVVHEKTTGEDGEKEQTVNIYYRFVGKID